MPGPPGTQPGDLYVDVHVTPHEAFEREGDDLITRTRLSFVDAALGKDVVVTLPEESTVKLSVPAGTQPGSVLTLPGNGMPRLDRRGKGNLHLVVDVAVPTKLSRRAKKLLAELAEELDQSTEPRADTG